jgi:hypothetical protein
MLLIAASPFINSAGTFDAAVSEEVSGTRSNAITADAHPP